MPINFSSHLRRFTSPCIISLSLLFTQTAAAEVFELGSFTKPISIAYGNSFDAPNDGQSFFSDWYSFSVSEANYSGLTVSLSFYDGSSVNKLGIDDLTSTLYSGSVIGGQVNIGATVAVSGIEKEWYTQSVQTSAITPPVYVAGDYLINIKGKIAGEYGGSYASVVNLSPVPLPPTFPLMAAGLGVLALIKRKRSYS